MHYTISKAQIERMQYILQLPNSALRSDEHNEMLSLLQGLLDQPEPEYLQFLSDVMTAAVCEVENGYRN